MKWPGKPHNPARKRKHGHIKRPSRWAAASPPPSQPIAGRAPVFGSSHCYSAGHARKRRACGGNATGRWAGGGGPLRCQWRRRINIQLERAFRTFSSDVLNGILALFTFTNFVASVLALSVPSLMKRQIVGTGKITKMYRIRPSCWAIGVRKGQHIQSLKKKGRCTAISFGHDGTHVPAHGTPRGPSPPPLPYHPHRGHSTTSKGRSGTGRRGVGCGARASNGRTG